MKKRTKRILTLAIILGLIITPVLLFLKLKSVVAPQAEMGSNVDSVEWLPSTASDISYYSRGGFGAHKFATFTISKEDIQAFAEKNEWLLEQQYGISTGFMEFVEVEEPDGIIKDGLIYEKRENDRGGITVVYNLKTNRAYYGRSAH